jgi:PAS domain S-box-containing protein
MMKDEEKKEQLVDELVKLRQRIALLEAEELERKQSEHEQILLRKRLEALWETARMGDLDFTELCDRILIQTMVMTESRYAFYGFLNEDESVMTIHSWSRDALAECQIQDKPIEFPIADAGLWGDAIRKREVVIVNDYEAPYESKKGLPSGHVSLTRILVVPVFSRNRINSLVAVANKASYYSDEDARQVEAFASSVQMIMEHKRAEEEMRQSHDYLRSITSSIHDGLIVIERDYSISYANEALAHQVGMAQEEIVGQTCHRVSHRSEVRCQGLDHKCPFKEVLETKAPSTEIHRHFTQGGDEIWVEVSCSPLLDEHGEVVRAIELIRDITDRIRAEEASKQAQALAATAEKLSSLERLAAGTCRDIVDPLNAIMMRLLAMINDPRTHPGQLEQLRELDEQAKQIAKVTGGLAHFTRQRSLKRQPLDLNEEVKRTLRLSSQDLELRNINLELRLHDSSPIILGDAYQLQEVVINLLNNARDAMPSGGRLGVGTDLVQIDEQQFVELRVEDTGEGILPEQIDKLFDPFFTSKFDEDSMGLGLSICKGIVEAHGGSVRVESEVGRGTTFFILLPFVEPVGGTGPIK